MEPYFAEYLDRIDDFLNAIVEAIEPLPQESLDWSPGENINAITVLVVHIAGATRFWIGDMAVGDPKPRNRADEFAAKDLTTAQLKAHVEELRAYAHSALARLTLADLATEYTSTNSQGVTTNRTAGWALLHALEHMALHVGHIQITRDWWNARQ